VEQHIYMLNIRIICLSGATYLHAQYQDNMSEWSNTSTHGLLFKSASTMKINFECVGLVQTSSSSSSHWKLTFFLAMIYIIFCSYKIIELALSNNHSVTHFNMQWLYAFFCKVHIKTWCRDEIIEIKVNPT
jgi:hypothetical protein